MVLFLRMVSSAGFLSTPKHVPPHLAPPNASQAAKFLQDYQVIDCIGEVNAGWSSGTSVTVTSRPSAIKAAASPETFRGHGSFSESMPNHAWLVLQVSFYNPYSNVRTSCYGLFVLPCPQQCFHMIADCWLAVLITLCGDVEENPGPEGQEMLNAIFAALKELQESEKKRDDTLSQMNSQLSRLDEVLRISKANEQKISVLEKSVKHFEKVLAAQDKKLNDYEDRARRNNLVVFGIPEKPDETSDMLEDMVVRQICHDRLGIVVKSLERIHRIGRLRNNKPRPIILRLYNFREKDSIMKVCFKLKDTGVSISHDYSQRTLAIRKKLWQSIGTDRKAGDRVRLVHDKLFVNNEAYTWDEGKNCRVLLRRANSPAQKVRNAKSGNRNED
ncbi:uncharacterized protein [Dermacentor albipictus]|uniref:uncharacterized protein n=1 Tax=Dermacentor albipictus TaxID=60249 RepID=UPI0038FC21C3